MCFFGKILTDSERSQFNLYNSVEDAGPISKGLHANKYSSPEKEVSHMYRIAICDADNVFLGHLSQNIESIMAEAGLEAGSDFEIEPFCEPVPMQHRILKNPSYYQILLLEVELPEENGLQLARRLRGQQVTCSIIFVTAHRDYVYDCFDIQPLWYFLKPVNVSKLKEVLLSDYRRNYAGTRLAVKIKGRQLAIPFQEIYALESTQHRTRIWLAEDFCDWNGPLSALKPQLPALHFCHSHNSYMVNLSHVKEIRRTDLLMDNDQNFPISRRYYNQIREKYLTYRKL